MILFKLYPGLDGINVMACLKISYFRWCLHFSCHSFLKNLAVFSEDSCRHADKPSILSGIASVSILTEIRQSRTEKSEKGDLVYTTDSDRDEEIKA